jgi:hypothetical protein
MTMSFCELVPAQMLVEYQCITLLFSCVVAERIATTAVATIIEVSSSLSLQFIVEQATTNVSGWMEDKNEAMDQKGFWKGNQILRITVSGGCLNYENGNFLKLPNTEKYINTIRY